MLTSLLIMLVLILLTALFVAGEFAVVSVSHSQVKELAENGNVMARQLWPILADSHKFDRYIAACQVGITITGLLLGAYGQARLSEWLSPYFGGETASYLLGPGILIALTAASMVLGELVPKSLALQFPVPTSLWTTYPMLFSLWVLHLPIAVLNGSGNGLLKMMGFKPEAHGHVHSPEEIILLLSEGENAGVLGSDERQRMQRAIEITDWTVRDLMVPRPYLQTLDVTASLHHNLKKIARSSYSTLLVHKEQPDQILGYIRCQEVLRYLLFHNQLSSLDNFIHPVLTIPRGLSIQRALDKFRSHRTRVALVVDDYGGVAGLLTMRDILAELVGSGGDESAHSRSYYRHLPDGRLRVSGQMRLDQLQEILQISWESEFASTVGGYLVSQIDRLPHRGQKLEVDGVSVEIEKVSARAILSILIDAREVPETKEEPSA
ncbi:MAG: hemolysin family protein [Candidatus Sericytochromatia bacterium]